MDMTPELWRTVMEAFEHCVDLPDGARGEYLAKLAVSHPEVSVEVVRMLGADQRADEFLEQSPLGALELDRGPGTQVGPYLLQRLVAEGGMARVFLACRTDAPMGKPVALKVIRPALDSREVVLRFEQERHILQGLDHPFIVALLDAGSTSTGAPFVVMEFVEGHTIDVYCDSQALDVASRVALFASVCSAVRYAHERGVIHRDLKPGNILVEKDGTPKLLDFGIAKLLRPPAEAINLTRTGRRLLTPAYASPEQITGGRITEATDVYALGMVLHQLLTGSLPYQADRLDLRQLSELITQTDVELPSRVAARTPERVRAVRELRGDLDMIVLKALDKVPGRRYAKAAQLEDDLRRFLDDRPISLRSSPLYLMSKAFQRSGKAGARGVRRTWALIAGQFTAELEVANRLRMEAAALIREGRRTEGIEKTRVVLTMAEQLSTRREVRREALRLASVTANSLAALLYADGERDAAAEMATRALAVNRLLQSEQREEPRVIANLRGNSANLGVLHAARGADASRPVGDRIVAWREARECFERAAGFVPPTLPADFGVPTDTELARRVAACDIALARLASTRDGSATT